MGLGAALAQASVGMGLGLAGWNLETGGVGDWNIGHGTSIFRLWFWGQPNFVTTGGLPRYIYYINQFKTVLKRFWKHLVTNPQRFYAIRYDFDRVLKPCRIMVLTILESI